MMCTCRAVPQEPITPESSRALIDGVIIPRHARRRLSKSRRRRKALEFYQSVFGGDLSIATYADIHAAEAPAQAGQVAFGRVAAPSGFDIMGYDVQPSKSYDPGQTDEIKSLWDALSDGAAHPHPSGARGFRAPVRHAHRPLQRHLDRRRRHCGKQLIVPAGGTQAAGEPIRR